MRRDEIPTPALVLDIDALRANIAIMAKHAADSGVGLRPHAKSHKCVEIARLLAKAGALGPACATIAEAEAMAGGGIAGILITSPIVTRDALQRLQRLWSRGADLMVVADQRANLEQLAAIGTADAPLPIIVELDVGVGRTGCRSIEDAVDLARRIAQAPRLRFAGVQAYWGTLQQVAPVAERRMRVAAQGERLAALVSALAECGHAPAIVTGGGTGTSWIDPTLNLFTELQPGSFLFLDSCYEQVDLWGNGNPFGRSLFVAAAVVSANDPDRVIVNAGYKAFATDSGIPIPARGAPPGSTYRFMGDEHGAVMAAPAASPIEMPPIGSVIELLASHCDPTVNLHSAYHVVSGDAVVDVWPIAARGYGAH